MKRDGRSAQDERVRLAALNDEASRQTGLPVELLGEYLSSVVTAACTGRPLSRDQLDACRGAGAEGARRAVTLAAVAELYMNATRRLWPLLPELISGRSDRRFPADGTLAMGSSVLAAVDSAIAAVADGHTEARRLVVRREEAARREFIDDLLTGQTDVGPLVERAERFGLHLAAAHRVVIVSAEQPFEEVDRVTAWVDSALRSRLGDDELLVTTKLGRLVCVLPSSSAQGDRTSSGVRDVTGVLEEIGRSITERSASAAPWRVGVGRHQTGPRGVYRSYTDAIEALDLAEKLDVSDRVVEAEQLLVYRVLLRDRTAMSDLVRAVVGPLEAARGGAGPLLDTLSAYFSSGGNAAEAARRLHVSVRAVTYRLQRVRDLSGYGPADPAQRLPLEIAVLGARMLNWPHEPLLEVE